jgi:hypothetical protein
MAMDTDPRKLAEELLDEFFIPDDDDIELLARELLKALDERDRLAEALQEIADDVYQEPPRIVYDKARAALEEK